MFLIEVTAHFELCEFVLTRDFKERGLVTTGETSVKQ